MFSINVKFPEFDKCTVVKEFYVKKMSLVLGNTYWNVQEYRNMMYGILSNCSEKNISYNRER